MGFRRVKIWRKYVRGVPTDEYKEEGYYDSTVYPDEDNCWGIEWRPVEGEYWCDVAIDGNSDTWNTTPQYTQVDSLRDNSLAWWGDTGGVYRCLQNYGNYSLMKMVNPENPSLGWTTLSETHSAIKSYYAIGYVDEANSCFSYVTSGGRFIYKEGFNTGVYEDSSSLLYEDGATSIGNATFTVVTPDHEVENYQVNLGGTELTVRRWRHGETTPYLVDTLKTPTGKGFTTRPVFDIRNRLVCMGTMNTVNMVSYEDGTSTLPYLAPGFGEAWQYSPLTKQVTRYSIDATKLTSVVLDGTVQSLGTPLYLCAPHAGTLDYPVMFWGGMMFYFAKAYVNGSSHSTRSGWIYFDSDGSSVAGANEANSGIIQNTKRLTSGVIINSGLTVSERYLTTTPETLYYLT